MKKHNIENQIYELEREIAALPQGSITTKKVRGHIYYYHRLSIDGKRKETYIDSEVAKALKKEIVKRKRLEQKLKELRLYLPMQNQEPILLSEESNYHIQSAAKKGIKVSETLSSFHTYIRIGDDLKRFSAPSKKLKKRDLFSALNAYLYNASEKVLILYGLRRTGKTTLIRQAVAEMKPSDFRKAAFIQVKSSNTLADINADLKLLESQGFRYVFLDEVTLLPDFIEGAALFSDIFASSGMKVILSGTDSLGFIFSEDEQLFDRCILLHTTFIPYREFENILDITGIDEYIRYGGTMSLSGTNYNDHAIFSDARRADEYIDQAIAKNIQHSLRFYQDGEHFRSLRQLFEQDELTGAINRVIEDMNHRFTIETLTHDFISHDLALSQKNLRADKKKGNDILDHIDVDTITKKLKKRFEILNKTEQQVQIEDAHVNEIKEYLLLLDLIFEIPKLSAGAPSKESSMTVITMPGIRYVQAKALIEDLLSDDLFKKLDIVTRNEILNRILNEIKGRMMEEIVLLETFMAKPKMNVFKLQFAVGEFDMVVANPETLTSEIYEIKYSKEIVPEQYRHLTDSKKCMQTEHRFGKIIGKYVIYRGETKIVKNIHYINVEEYLKEL